ncbi:MAG: lytic transglycosylase domain-containing protein, partial [Ahrensia sp.]
HFFARLIWKESRFDALAVSPVGAQGIAQFMPGTAVLRGLADSFDITQAIPASAEYLAELKAKFGNLGLAAAAYNGGEARVMNWLGGRGFLPLETENYVLTITGEQADVFRNRSRTIRDLPVEPDKSFAEGCRRLPIIETRSPAMAQTLSKPWAVQVAGHFNRAVAERAWQRIEQRYRPVLEGLPHAISRAPTPMGRRSIYAVRVGADSRDAANAICTRLRQNGGSCVVMKNR